jgi:hypothetical protein
MSKPPGKCVFCGQPGLTKGHIWPEWFEKYLPRSSHHIDTVREYYDFTPGKAPETSTERVRQGDAGSRRPRNTCLKCNNEWMSRLERAAMPVIVPLIRGEPCLLDTIGQRILAGFLCLITARVAFTSPKTLAIPQCDRVHIMKWLEPPRETWKIWLAKYQGDRGGEHWCSHHGLHVLSTPDEESGPYKCNTQITTFVFGKVCANVFSSTAWPGFRGYRGVHLTKLWPEQSHPIDWRSVPIISDDQIFGLAESVAKARRAE